MIVDDSKLSRKILRELLEEIGHLVSLEASSGEEAIELYKPDVIDCVLFDVEMGGMMGGMSGIEAMKILKDIHCDMKAIIVSSVSEATRIKEAIMNGADMIVQKPATLESLQKAVVRVLGN